MSFPPNAALRKEAFYPLYTKHISLCCCITTAQNCAWSMESARACWMNKYTPLLLFWCVFKSSPRRTWCCTSFSGKLFETEKGHKTTVLIGKRKHCTRHRGTPSKVLMRQSKMANIPQSEKEARGPITGSFWSLWTASLKTRCGKSLAVDKRAYHNSFSNWKLQPSSELWNKLKSL